MILYSKWLSLPINTRHKIAHQFGIPKRGSTEVVNNEIVKDGYHVKEVEEALNIKALQEYLETAVIEHAVLFDYMITKINGGIVLVPEPVVEVRLPDNSIEIHKESEIVFIKPKSKKHAKSKKTTKK